MLLHYVAKHGNMKIASFHSNVVISALLVFSPWLFDFFILLTCNSYSCCYRLPKSCIINWLSCDLSGTYIRRNEVVSYMQQLLTCVAERQIILSPTMCLITANICWDSKISHQYCPSTFHLRLNKEQLSLLT